MSGLIVHHLPGAWGLPSVSPFCLKLDTYLRMVGLPFDVVVDATTYGLLANILLAPDIASPVKDYGLGRTRLFAYIERMRDLYFP